MTAPRLHWRTLAVGELALLLQQARLDDSRAVGEATVYRLHVDGQESLAVSLPDGQAVLVDAQTLHAIKRRQFDDTPLR